MKMNDRNQSGFTLIELLVVIVIIGILAAIALPNFIKARNKAREAEVKSNVHSIQLALERYATDNSGVYPTYLTGGERDSNILACAVGNRLGTMPLLNATWPNLIYGGNASTLPQGITPYSVVAPKDALGNSTGRFGNRYDVIEGDPLLVYGYLSQYPRNPFARRDSGLWNSNAIGGTTMTGIYPYGGHHGDIMFDLGFGWGDAPQTDFVLYTTENLEENDPDSVADPDLDAPGNFFYHPTFSDGIPLYFHSQQLIRALEGGVLTAGIYGEDVLGFFLYGYGAAGDRDSLVEGGQDVFNRMPAGFPDNAAQPPFPNYDAYGRVLYHGSNASGQARSQCTGYNSIEFDPYTGAYPDGLDARNPDVLTVKSGSDGVQDWVVIVVAAGSDQAPDFVRDTLTYGELP